MDTTPPAGDSDDQYQAYGKQLLEYQDAAFRAASEGSYKTAIEIWAVILTDQNMRDFFNQDPEALREIAWNLGITQIADGDAASGRELLEQWSFPLADYEELLG